MKDKQVSAECTNCDSSFAIGYVEEFVSNELPEYCPFCGEQIEDIQEEYIEDEDDDLDNGEWD